MATSEGIDAGVSFAFSELLEKATADPIWARLPRSDLASSDRVCPKRSRQSEGGSNGCEGSGPVGRSGRRAGSRYHQLGYRFGSRAVLFNEGLRSICHARLLTLCSEPSAPLEFDVPRFQPSRLN